MKTGYLCGNCFCFGKNGVVGNHELQIFNRIFIKKHYTGQKYQHVKVLLKVKIPAWAIYEGTEAFLL